MRPLAAERPPEPAPQEVAEACAKVCESRAKSLFHDSHKLMESIEANKCASAIRGGWSRHLPAGVAERRDPPADEVVMPVAVAERVYRAICGLPADLTPELCEATEDFYRYVRLRGALRAGGVAR